MFFAVGKTVHFTDEENTLFMTRYENGFDVKTDERYNLWVAQQDGEIDQDNEGKSMLGYYYNV